MNTPNKRISLSYWAAGVFLTAANLWLAGLLFLPDTEFGVPNICFWPWWVFLLPILGIVTACVMLIRSGKSGGDTIRCLIPLFMLFQTAEAAPTIKEIMPAREVSEAELKFAVQTGSASHPRGGFSADAAVVKCFAALEYRYTGGRYDNEPIRFRLRKPSRIETEKKYPLILWFHGKGESDDDNTRQLAHLQASLELLTGPKQRDFFMIATQCPKDNDQWIRSMSSEDGKGDAPLTIVSEIMEAVLAQYPIDPDRISVFGLSSGGTAVWEFVRRHPHRIAAMASCSGLPPLQTASPDKFISTVIWAFGNRHDPTIPHDAIRRYADSVAASGGDAQATIYEDYGHNSWTRAMRDDRVLDWLLLQHSGKSGPPQGFSKRHSASAQFFLFGLPILTILSIVLLSLCKQRRKD